ncbi:MULTISPECIES: hypothetical protein [Micromonospora]|uniref:hypothetical protein n=1 Tax=Micromonospora TaxID=1873 RepID=UPI001374C0FE|nr:MULTISPECIES: hypothetical protein [unclassified Micromonospora]MBM0224585.1 hypothetical protein [Micromonospora sp. ATA51]
MTAHNLAGTATMGLIVGGYGTAEPAGLWVWSRPEGRDPAFALLPIAVEFDRVAG